MRRLFQIEALPSEAFACNLGLGAAKASPGHSPPSIRLTSHLVGMERGTKTAHFRLGRRNRTSVLLRFAGSGHLENSSLTRGINSYRCTVVLHFHARPEHVLVCHWVDSSTTHIYDL